MRIPLTILLLPFFLPVMGLPASSDKANKGKAPAEEDTHAQSVNYYEIEAYKSFSGSECTDSVSADLTKKVITGDTVLDTVAQGL
ncbi:hypothetical protein LENED_002238 [Lentinula edodes]|uniref:Uncharacterized protein n=1 Tax=Lentinula edodes TaxID=5353 RepID=A0A1Q3E0P6_LENED|nr:hypothetical protein LENED_002238 [Lentinula edodes]